MLSYHHHPVVPIVALNSVLKKSPDLPHSSTSPHAQGSHALLILYAQHTARLRKY